jgi:hypothetical protein
MPLHPALQDPDAGLGLTATSAICHNMSHPWLGRRVGSLLLRGSAHQTVSVATVPLHLAMTADSARQDPQLGSSYAELLDLGLLDERNAVIVMLLVERMRGRDSRYAPYIQLLPERCEDSSSSSSPLMHEKHEVVADGALLSDCCSCICLLAGRSISEDS